jgi:hypothetical protein
LFLFGQGNIRSVMSEVGQDNRGIAWKVIYRSRPIVITSVVPSLGAHN